MIDLKPYQTHIGKHATYSINGIEVRVEVLDVAVASFGRGVLYTVQNLYGSKSEYRVMDKNLTIDDDDGVSQDDYINQERREVPNE